MQEIERKFLVKGDGWRPGAPGVLQRQGYLAVTERGVVRVRLEGGRALLNVKGPQQGLTRDEFEYEIPLDDAEAMLARLCGLVIEKTRHFREFAGFTWEVDVFHGANAGLVTAEVELPDESAAVPLPPWVGEDVSHDVRYRVAWLAQHPFTTWANRASSS